MLRSRQVHRAVSGVKKFRRIFTIYVTKNDAFCRDVETHFESSPLTMFKRKNSGPIFTIYASKHEAFCREVDALWKYSACILYKKNHGHIFMIYASKNEAVCCEVETHFGSSPLARFTKKILGTFSRFMHPKAKLFAVMFIRIWDVFALQGL